MWGMDHKCIIVNIRRDSACAICTYGKTVVAADGLLYILYLAFRDYQRLVILPLFSQDTVLFRHRKLDCDICLCFSASAWEYGGRILLSDDQGDV